MGIVINIVVACTTITLMVSVLARSIKNRGSSGCSSCSNCKRDCYKEQEPD